MLKFFKMHGIGNDYIFVDNLCNEYNYNFSKLAKKLSVRRFGIGSDGLVLISSCSGFDAKMQIFNSDGSVAKLCGNATRCVAFYLAKKFNKQDISIFCHGKILSCKVKIIRQDKAVVCVNMGNANLVKTHNNFFVVNIGNKHLVVVVKNFNFNIKKVGQKLNRKFGQKVNVEFLKIWSKDKIQIKVYERGSGITLACGSGACACCFVANKHLGLNKKITVKLDGGNLVVKIGEQIKMIGECKFVYSGEIL